jgi:membrane-associated protease RseP (regulator of RpoE activity)
MPSEDQDSSEGLLSPPAFVWTPHKKFQDRRWINILLLLVTVASTTWVGADNYAAFVSNFSTVDVPLALGPLIVRGVWYSGTILAILGCHELGHYFACRYYDVDASLPFFLPNPLLTGTFGAFIKIREPIPSKRMLFDIGIAGPLAGFVVAVPALVIGMALSNVARVPVDMSGLEIGEPLLFKIVSRLFFGVVADGYSVNMHPMAFAAWFGMLATALNLFPIGQLDGGHISYAVLGRKSSNVTLVMVGIAVVLTFFSWSWLVWTILTIAMLFFFGRHHPRVYDEDEPLDRTRLILAGVAVLMFILCFTPTPITELVK